MLVSSIYGVFSIGIQEEDPDKLVIKARKKEALQRIFDEKRISLLSYDKFNFSVNLCKQELAHILIMMIKEIDYTDFEKVFDESSFNSDQTLVK
ncbi:hypothetical protein [Mongoliibacter ruber]|uniref:Uncharacterized protein n=1 Tax=Mongoliibacter ruber TaxID=1750599 RepID=A0A2T0WVH2_9BACT|nr:hypothetical protein [Mongoliibacter ruber]PRY90680.1 hypothetical protein CLW00_101344 [Mongoliibacter ruber]